MTAREHFSAVLGLTVFAVLGGLATRPHEHAENTPSIVVMNEEFAALVSAAVKASDDPGVDKQTRIAMWRRALAKLESLLAEAKDQSPDAVQLQRTHGKLVNLLKLLDLDAAVDTAEIDAIVDAAEADNPRRIALDVQRVAEGRPALLAPAGIEWLSEGQRRDPRKPTLVYSSGPNCPPCIVTAKQLRDPGVIKQSRTWNCVYVSNAGGTIPRFDFFPPETKGGVAIRHTGADESAKALAWRLYRSWYHVQGLEPPKKP